MKRQRAALNQAQEIAKEPQQKKKKLSSSLSVARSIGAVPPIKGRGPERKFWDINYEVAQPYDNQVYLLNGIAAGTAANQRVGRLINLKSLAIRISTYFDETRVNNPAPTRFLVVYDKSPNNPASAPAPSLFLTTPTGAPTQFLGFNQLYYNDRFLTLIDCNLQEETTEGQVANTATEQGQNTAVDFYRKFNLEQVFAGTGATIDQISTGCLYAMFVPLANNQTTGTTATWRMNSRVRFFDA